MFGKKTHSTKLAVRQVTLDELLPCEVMKLDCEGGEWAIIGDPRIAEVPVMFGEYHYGGGPDQVIGVSG